MLTIRLTKQLQDRLKLKPESEPGISTTRLGDWYANVVYVGRRPYVPAVSERTLLPVVFPLKGVKDLRAVLIVHVEEALDALGLGAAQVKVELDAMRQVHIATTASTVALMSRAVVPFFTLLLMLPTCEASACICQGGIEALEGSVAAADAVFLAKVAGERKGDPAICKPKLTEEQKARALQESGENESVGDICEIDPHACPPIPYCPLTEMQVLETFKGRPSKQATVIPAFPFSSCDEVYRVGETVLIVGNVEGGHVRSWACASHRAGEGSYTVRLLRSRGSTASSGGCAGCALAGPTHTLALWMLLFLSALAALRRRNRGLRS